MKPGAIAVLVPNIGEDAERSIDSTHVSIYPRRWWKKIIEDCDLSIRKGSSRRAANLAVHIGPHYPAPSLRPGSFITEKQI